LIINFIYPCFINPRPLVYKAKLGEILEVLN